MSLKLHLVVNGAGPAFLRKIGCPCVRCAEPVIGPDATRDDYAELLAWTRQAHTSVSLVIERDGVAIDHTLVDCGMGVTQNLVGLPSPAQGQPVNRVLFTHGHLDHISGLDGLIFGLLGARRAGDFTLAEQPWPLPIYCTRSTWRHNIAMNPDDPADTGHFRHLSHHLYWNDVTEAALDLAALDLHPALTVTPIPVEHFGQSVHYLFTFWPSGAQGTGDSLRVAVCWDLLAYPAGRKNETWRDTRLDPRAGQLPEMLAGVDVLFAEMTAWRGGAPGHIGWLPTDHQASASAPAYGVRDLIQLWRPGVTRLIHYSGWEDRQGPDGAWLGGEALRRNTDPARGPVTDAALRAAVQADLGPEFDIDVAQSGDVLTCA